jgi:hypothetical protein
MRRRRRVITCVPGMVVVAFEHGAILIIGLTILLLTEHSAAPDPFRRPGRVAEAICLVALAVGLGAWAFLHVGNLP